MSAENKALAQRRPRLDLRQKIGLVIGPLLCIAVALALRSAGQPLAAQAAGATVALMAAWWMTEPVPLWLTGCIPLLSLPLAGLPLSGVVLQYFDSINILVTWMKFGMPVVLIAIPLTWLYLVRFAAPLPAQGFEHAAEAVNEARAKLGPPSRGEIAAFAGFLAAALLWIFRKDIELGALTIPGWSRLLNFSWQDLLGTDPGSFSEPAAKWFTQDFGDAAVALAIGIVLLLLPLHLRPLRMALSVREAGKGISVGLLLLLGGGFAMAYGMQQSGLSTWFAGLLSGTGKMDRFTATLLVCIVATVMTEVASNTATASILLPLIAASAAGVGLSPAPLMLAATLSASFGFMLPAGTPPNAIVYSSGYISVPQMARSGLLVDIGGAILVTLVCYFLAPLVLRT